MNVYRLLAAGVGALLALGSASAQDAAKVAEPEFNFAVFALNPTNGSLIPLERKPVNMQTKVRALGFGGAQGLTVFSGESSPIRFKEGQKIEFVIRLETQGIDPSTLVRLESLSKGKGKRELETVHVGAFGTNAGSTNGKSTQGVNFARYGEHSYRIVPADPLTKGEYVFRTGGSGDGFLFGVD